LKSLKFSYCLQFQIQIHQMYSDEDPGDSLSFTLFSSTDRLYCPSLAWCSQKADHFLLTPSNADAASFQMLLQVWDDNSVASIQDTQMSSAPFTLTVAPFNHPPAFASPPEDLSMRASETLLIASPSVVDEDPRDSIAFTLNVDEEALLECFEVTDTFR